MTFYPHPTRNGYSALAVILICSLIIAFLLNRLPQQENLATIFMLFLAILINLAVMVVAVGWAILSFKLRYQVSRNGIMIQWGFAQQPIPFNEIEQIISAKNLPAPLEFRGFNLLGLRFGSGQVLGYGPTQFFTTTPLANSLLIITPHQSYYVSPLETEAFLQAWKIRQELQPTQQWKTELHRNWPFNIPILADKLTWGFLSVGLLICLMLFGYLAFMFPNLPQLVPLQFNLVGQVYRTADKALLFLFPIVGAGMLALNTVLGGMAYRNERLAAYFAWASAVVIQLGLWVAVYTLVRAL